MDPLTIILIIITYLAIGVVTFLILDLVFGWVAESTPGFQEAGLSEKWDEQANKIMLESMIIWPFLLLILGVFILLLLFVQPPKE